MASLKVNIQCDLLDLSFKSCDFAVLVTSISFITFIISSKLSIYISVYPFDWYSGSGFPVNPGITHFPLLSVFAF